MVESGRFLRLQALFEGARDLDPDARAAYLDRECGDSDELREEVSRLLARHGGSGVLDKPIRRGAPPERVPERLGPFRIVEPLGRGGMGTVYRAEQEHPKRMVALKIMHAGFASPELRRRFEFETSVLARLRHPGIAQIYEVAEWDDGLERRPYFAMELVEGVALDEFNRRERPSTAARLRLFVDICAAVEHAHQKGVIHRDLKPQNILVTADGAPKILDFGVARATDADVQATMHTTPGQLVGTLAYMSPEQVVAASDRLDTRSDVYALGVILYEMLAGRLPYDLAEKLLTGVARVISDRPPIPLASTDRAYRGDLTTIVNKALEKSPERRYASVSELAADVHRYLANEPIAARPASAIYQMRKFAQRNTALVGGILATAVALVAGLSLAVSALRVASYERDENKAVTQFLSEMLGAADPAREGKDARVVELLAAAAERIEAHSVDQPLVAAKIHYVIGTTYQVLGVYDRAAEHLEKALAIRTERLGERAQPTIDSMRELGVVYNHWGQYDRSQALLEHSLDLCRETLGETNTTTIAGMNELAILYGRQGRRDLAVSLYERALELNRKLAGDDDTLTLSLMGNLGLAYKRMGRFDDAHELYEETLAARRRVLGDDHPATLTSMNNLAHLYRALGRKEEAAALHAETLERRRRVLGDEHPHTLMSMDNLAMLLMDLDRYDEAEPLFEEALALKRRVLGEEHPETLVTMNNLGVLYHERKQDERAEPLLRQTLEARRRTLGERHESTATSLVNLANTCATLGKLDEADQLYVEALGIRREVLGADHPEVAKGLVRLAGLRFDRGSLADAEQLYGEALAICEKRLDPEREDVARLRAHLTEVRQLLRTNEQTGDSPTRVGSGE